MSVTGGMIGFMKRMLEEYKSLRGRTKDSGVRPFWDVVVITTADEDQRKAFQLQIDDKAGRRELPLDLPIHVVTDPPGTRIGNGGSTLTALEHLHNEYGAEMYQMKTLLIHAGGWSQRMPSASVLGKVFSALPHGEPLYQMLDLKLAMYWSLVDKMKPGVLLVCADDFLVYNLGSDSDWSIPDTGFTAFAHPSSIEMGRTHGVYVIADQDKINRQRHVSIEECLEVLQKPTDERMEKQGAILEGQGPFVFADDLTLEGKVVYTDSSFYFGTDVMKSLLDLKKKIGHITCEIDAYGDFLQALGPRATAEYIDMTGNISLMTSDLKDTRMKVFNHLKGTDIHLLVMNASKFIHIGTTKEYIYHLCEDKEFQQQLSFSKDVFNVWTDSFNHNNHKRPKMEHESFGCVMHSLLPKTSSTPVRSVMEYCHFDVPVSVQHNTIVSNCQFLLAKVSNPPMVLTVPKGCFLHTVPICVDDSTEFVTIFLDIFDNIKKSCSSEDVTSLSFLGKTIEDFCSSSDLTVKELIPKDSSGNAADKISLWTLKLFAAQSSMTESFYFSLTEMKHLISGKKTAEPSSRRRLSMADLLKVKDVAAMLKYRRNLFQAITAAKN
ncbi:fucose-1-phosphate guanylyltransferase-like [Haliotis cracherodii]|uniref:fucose-1-phosphate guanylyltransferase-like n=1 Tax=Haliotis cracherodii TaxID=6455 RepID=UPI0039E96F6B